MTQFNATTYNIERPTGVCAFTGRTLEVGESYIATLVEVDPNDPQLQNTPAQALGMKRLDVSRSAWDQGQRPERLFGFWRSVVPEPNQKKKLFVDDELLLQLFHRLEDAQQEDRLAFRFVLALILMRKRLLRYEGTRQEHTGGATNEWWQLTPKGQTQSVEVLNPQMDEAKIQQVTAQLGQVLQAEL